MVTIPMPNGDQVWSRTKAGRRLRAFGCQYACRNLLHDLATGVLAHWSVLDPTFYVTCRMPALLRA